MSYCGGWCEGCELKTWRKQKLSRGDSGECVPVRGKVAASGASDDYES